MKRFGRFVLYPLLIGGLTSVAYQRGALSNQNAEIRDLGAMECGPVKSSTPRVERPRSQGNQVSPESLSEIVEPEELVDVKGFTEKSEKRVQKQGKQPEVMADDFALEWRIVAQRDHSVGAPKGAPKDATLSSFRADVIHAVRERVAGMPDRMARMSAGARDQIELTGDFLQTMYSMLGGQGALPDTTRVYRGVRSNIVEVVAAANTELHILDPTLASLDLKTLFSPGDMKSLSGTIGRAIQHTYDASAFLDQDVERAGAYAITIIDQFADLADRHGASDLGVLSDLRDEIQILIDAASQFRISQSDRSKYIAARREAEAVIKESDRTLERIRRDRDASLMEILEELIAANKKLNALDSTLDDIDFRLHMIELEKSIAPIAPVATQARLRSTSRSPDRRHMFIVGFATNNSGKRLRKISVEFTLHNSDGYQVGTVSEATSHLDAGAIWKFSIRIPDAHLARFEEDDSLMGMFVGPSIPRFAALEAE